MLSRFLGFLIVLLTYRWRIEWLLLPLVLTGIAVPPYLAVAQKSYDEVLTFRVGTECTYPPYTYRTQQGKLIGFDIDILNGIAERSNMKIEYVCHVWEGIFDSMVAGDFHAAMSGIAITDERKKSMDFSDSYQSFFLQFMQRVESKHGFYDVPKLKVGVQADTVHDYYITAKFPTSKIFRYDTFRALLAGLKAGDVDVIFNDPTQSFFYMKDHGGSKWLKLMGPRIFDAKIIGTGTGIAIRYGQLELKERVNEGLASMKSDGTLEKLERKYFGVE